MKAAIHITHEAAQKIGGIGAVLNGMCTAKAYLNEYKHTIFYGPLFQDQPFDKNRLGQNSVVLYSDLDNIRESEYNFQFDALVSKYKINLIYGKRNIFDELYPEKSNTVDIVLIGIKNLDKKYRDIFKFKLWEKYGFSSEFFEGDWDFEQYLRIAIPLREICNVILQEDCFKYFYSHEYMGVASCLGIHMEKETNEKIIFHAHEVSTYRNIVEPLPGHDTAFYKQMALDQKAGISFEERFGKQSHNARHELIKKASLFDKILAVGDWVKEEYMYLNPNCPEDKIVIAYNGLPIKKTKYTQKLKSRKILQDYCETLFNFKPDIIFTHTTRLVISKGLWRDISFLEEMDKLFTKHQKKGFFILLSTLIGTGRSPEEIRKMESDYGWPIKHQEEWPDLVGYEKDIYQSLEIFNAKSRNIKGVFINQYGFSSDRLGKRLPDDATFSDLRVGSDAELGFSVYEPFGIAQIETVPFGGPAILSRACGSAFLLESAYADYPIKPYYILDFSETEPELDKPSLTAEERVTNEKRLFLDHSHKIFKMLNLSNTERKELFEFCNNHSYSLEWDTVFKKID